jgi:hypothetical protein
MFPSLAGKEIEREIWIERAIRGDHGEGGHRREGDGDFVNDGFARARLQRTEPSHYCSA